MKMLFIKILNVFAALASGCWLSVKTPWCCEAYARLDNLFQWFLVIILNRSRGNHSGRRWSGEYPCC